ncbi:cytidylate kinase-like family protein [Acetobacterium woodii]|nr:cytidylate kinase-like family protein [Acetobacterium woodii]
MNDFVIAIAREFGSGGRIVGELLAQELKVPFYDKELVSLAAKESGFAEEFIQEMEQKRRIDFLNNMYMTSQELPLSEQVFLAQSKAIQEIAKNQSCVIVGRCADYVLRDKKNCIRVFIHAPLELRIKRVKEEYHINKLNLHEYVKKEDKNRGTYYNYFTQEKWGDVQNYHLTIDSSVGIPIVVDVIKTLLTALPGGVVK